MKVCEVHEGSSLHGEPDNTNNNRGEESHAKGGHISHFLPTSRRIVQFSNGGKVFLSSSLIVIIILG